MAEEILTLDEKAALGKYRAERDQDVLTRLASENELEKERRLANQAVELPLEQWTDENKKALHGYIVRMLT